MIDYCNGCNKRHSDTNWLAKVDEHSHDLVHFCSRYFTPQPYEWAPESIKRQREQFRDDIIQPFREGEPSKEFADKYPKQAAKIYKNEPAYKKKTLKNVWK